jgi:hypothetical protein
MKKVVVVKQESDVIDLSQITNDSIVGVKWRSGNKSFIIEVKRDEFACCEHKKLSFVNSWTTKTILEYVSSAINDQGAKCFVFDTFKELYQWLAEDEL